MALSVLTNTPKPTDTNCPKVLEPTSKSFKRNGLRCSFAGCSFIGFAALSVLSGGIVGFVPQQKNFPFSKGRVL